MDQRILQEEKVFFTISNDESGQALHSEPVDIEAMEKFQDGFLL
jgi:hypothetical protein